MRVHITIIIALIYNLSSYCQTNKQFNSGEIYKIRGVITDKTTKDTLRGVTVEFMNIDAKQIKAMRTDFDGVYISSFCSNQLKNDTLLIKTTNVFYKQEVFYYKINSDSVININMRLDKNKTISKEKFEEYNTTTLYFVCGLDKDNEIEYQMNRTYRNYCSGKIKKYQSLINDNEDLSEWMLLEY